MGLSRECGMGSHGPREGRTAANEVHCTHTASRRWAETVRFWASAGAYDGLAASAGAIAHDGLAVSRAESLCRFLIATSPSGAMDRTKLKE